MRQHDKGQDRHGHDGQQGIIRNGSGQQESLIAFEFAQHLEQEAEEPAKEPVQFSWQDCGMRFTHVRTPTATLPILEFKGWFVILYCMTMSVKHEHEVEGTVFPDTEK